MAPCVLGQTAYVKAVLHALKYPAQAVNGVLVGTSGPNGAGVKIVDAVPLMHGQLALAPLLEVALTQVEAHYEAQHLRIVGYYQANERAGDLELSSAGKKIADKIASHFPGAVALLIDNLKLPNLLDPAPAQVMKLYQGYQKWTADESPSGVELEQPGAPKILAEYIRESRHQRLADFLDHVQDITCDWLNPDIMS